MMYYTSDEIDFRPWELKFNKSVSLKMSIDSLLFLFRQKDIEEFLDIGILYWFRRLTRKQTH